MRVLSGVMRISSGLLLLAAGAGASPEILRQANELYQRTEYENSLRVLAQDPAPDAAGLFLSGKNYFMSGDYKKATEFFEKALAISPSNSEYELWLGRTWGRRAETGSWLTAPGYASKAKDCFEKAVALDPRNSEAKNDLFDYYLNAPGFLGGGVEKAEAAAKSIAGERPAEYEFEEARLAEHKKDFTTAEAHLRRAIQLAPDQPGRLLDLARFLAKRGRLSESDRLFEDARKLAPGRANVDFAQASMWIETHRNLDQARTLLQAYLRASLTPDDPPRQEAQKLLRRAVQPGNEKSAN
jgi:Flp pilus assembly protein TadD